MARAMGRRAHSARRLARVAKTLDADDGVSPQSPCALSLSSGAACFTEAAARKFVLHKGLFLGHNMSNAAFCQHPPAFS
ncbi:hypothetical protein PSAB6_340277 [Paraburkholderia sabiae]|nr:hypothetical protein PSAB6_340277 [Paraburkholderia sabiae]